MKAGRIYIAKYVVGQSTTTKEGGEWRAWGDCGRGMRRRSVGHVPHSKFECCVLTKSSTIAIARRAFFLFFCVYVGNVAFSFPRKALVFSFSSVCRRLVVFSLFFAIANTLGCSAWFFLKSCGPWLSCVGFAAKHCFRSQLGGDVGFHARER